MYLELECDIHGVFTLRSDDLKHRGCKQCSRDKIKAEYDAKWKMDCTKIHKNKYDYSDTEVGDVLTHSKIYCKKHKEFFNQTPASHKSGRGCPLCAYDEGKLKLKMTIDQVEEKAKKLGYNYDFSESVYINSKERFKLRCDKGHTFYISSANLLSKDMSRGCPSCKRNSSTAEQQLFEYISNYVECINNDRIQLDGYEIDIYVPSLRLGIEYNGLYWHNDEMQKISHFDKKSKASEKNIHLIHVYEDDWVNRPDFVKNRLVDILQIKSEGYINIPVSKAHIEEIEGEFYYEMYSKFTLEPEVKIDGILGLYYRNRVLAILPYQIKPELSCLIIDVIRNPYVPNSNYYDTIITILKQANKNFKIACSIDWLDDIYMTKQNILDYEYLLPPYKKYIDKQTTSKYNKTDKTITKPGYAIFKL